MYSFRSRPHATRRTFVTVGSRIGLPHHIVKKLANHAQQVDIASTYIILGVECLREPMQQLTDKFMELMDCDMREWVPTAKSTKTPTLHEVLNRYLEVRKLGSETDQQYPNESEMHPLMSGISKVKERLETEHVSYPKFEDWEIVRRVKDYRAELGGFESERAKLLENR